MTNLTMMPAGGRGCGKRVSGGVYGCVSLDPDGVHLSHFLLDPPIPYLGTAFQGVHEAPEYITAGWDTDTDLVLMDWVGESGYKAVPDFVEEVRRFGMSRRLPTTFPFEVIKERQVWLALIHAKAAPDMLGLSKQSVPWGYDWCKWEVGQPPFDPYLADHFPHCLYHNWPLAYRLHGLDPYDVDVNGIPMPWGEYHPTHMVNQMTLYDDMDVRGITHALPPETSYPHPGFFAVIPLSHLEAVDYVDPDVAARVENSGLELFVVEE